MATPLAPLKFWIAFEFADPENLTISAKKVFDFLRRSEFCAILAYFSPNLVAMATPLAPLKFYR